MPYLIITKGDSPGQAFDLDREATLIGKGADCDIILADPHVSKAHARIDRTRDGFYIEDLESTNKTKVAGRCIRKQRLSYGDIIKICGYHLEYVADVERPESPPTILSEIDATAAADGTATEVRSEEKLRAIMEIVAGLTGVLGLGRVLEKVLGSLFRTFPGADRAFFLFKDADGPEICTGAIKVRHPGSPSPTVSRTIYEYVTGEGRAILCEDVAADVRFAPSRSVAESRARTMMCVPLWDHGRRAVGVLQVDAPTSACRFVREDLDFLVAVAGAVGMAVENARLHDVAIRQEKTEQEGRDARAMQQALLPERPPDLPGYAFWHYYEPARFVGGDYFDYRPLPRLGVTAGTSRPGRWAIALGDVSGKGMPAALLMARLSSEVRLLLQAEADPARVVGRLNSNLCDGGTAEKFVTFLLLVLDGDRHELTVVNAGHMGLLIRRADGRIEVFGEDQRGTVLGVVDGEDYQSATTRLGDGDVAVAYTDGVLDATSLDAVQFGIERLREAISGAPAGAGPVGESVREAVRRHAAGREPFDDITLLSFGRP